MLNLIIKDNRKLFQAKKESIETIQIRTKIVIKMAIALSKL